MTEPETITLTRAQYEALITSKEELEDRVAALDADDGSRIPHEVALAIMRGVPSDRRVPIASWRHGAGAGRQHGNRHGVPVRDRTRTQTRLCERPVPNCRGARDND